MLLIEVSKKYGGWYLCGQWLGRAASMTAAVHLLKILLRFGSAVPLAVLVAPRLARNGRKHAALAMSIHTNGNLPLHHA